MATKTTETPKADTPASDNKPLANAALDVLPPADDDAEPAPGAAAAPVANEEPADQTAAPERPARVDPRAEAAKRYREIRDADIKKAKEEAGEATDEPAVKAEADAPTEAAPEAPAKAPAAPAQKHKIIIDGVAEEVTTEELVRRAQMHGAADKRFDQAKRLLEEAKAERAAKPVHPPASQQTPQDQPDPSQTAPPEHQPAKRDREKLKAAAERIQVGDNEDGADALAELLEEARKEILAEVKAGKAADPDEVDRRIDQRLTQKASETEINDAIAQFGKDHQDIMSNKYLTQAAMTAVQDQMIEEMKTLGIPEDEIKKHCDTPEKTGTAYRHLRQSGRKLPTFTEVFNKGAQTLRENVGLKAPDAPAAPSSQTPQVRPAAPTPSAAEQRLDRKRAAPSQPRSAGVRGTVAPVTPPKTKADIIADMRKARHFNH